MVEYYGIDMSEGTDIAKTSALRECVVWNYCYFLEISFRFQPKVCACCYDFMQKAMIFNDVAIAFVKESYYGINFLYMSSNEAIKLLRSADLTGKSGAL